VSPPQQRNDRRQGFSPRADGRENGRRGPREHRSGGSGGGWIWGRHAVLAALANPARAPLRRLLATADAMKAVTADAAARKALQAAGLQPQIMDAGEIGRAIGQAGASHQGLALAAAPIEPVDLDELADPARGVLVVLDQVTDPQNVGAILRSAAAFGARGVVVQDRHAPPLAGALVKAAAGALEVTPVARVVNLARALDRLSDLGWRAVGLSGTAETTLEEALDGGPTVLVLGSEGEGMRRLVGEHCDALARIPMPGGFESLNVSTAAAIALYESVRALGARPAGE
jgi:23S rRNA (guanosine2251-2'-O)-methyltransferase